ncbi:hypothetical protein SAMN04488020_11729 [Palleronia marisminoris]|uniref:Uncharacterized protein n=1 Tax=Palleronia marisminoris TaxID=315423 RepID=A0A1Y5TQN9_9RHOB|nr:hypothetical protein [Palleronia marisminoris]SFH49004.1 hypothetical protein SAMN04488020_11729 [Palleronia marisminoris]SLN69810.1 hypothetical protein PAM7066_03531 [Palleronia marisminoris]
MLEGEDAEAVSANRQMKRKRPGGSDCESDAQSLIPGTRLPSDWDAEFSRESE